MAGKWHTDAAAYTAGEPTKALPFGRLVRAYTAGYERYEPAAPLAADTPGIDAYTQGQADAALGLDPGFTAEVAPEPPPDPPPEKKEHKTIAHNGLSSKKEHRK